MIYVTGNFCPVRKLKWPLSSVVTSCVVPLMCTVAPAKGSFVDLSSTLPDKVILLCATATEANNKIERKGERSRPQLVFDMSVYLTSILKCMNIAKASSNEHQALCYAFRRLCRKGYSEQQAVPGNRSTADQLRSTGCRSEDVI